MVLGLAVPPQARPTAGAATAPSGTVLVVTYSDGRSVPQLSRSAWTTKFPRLADWQLPSGDLIISAVQYNWEPIDGGFLVNVSVLRGSPHQAEDKVATKKVLAGMKVTVPELQKWGIDTVELSTTADRPIGREMPVAVSTIPELQVSVEDVVGTRPGYRVVMRNTGAKAIRSVEILTLRDGRLGTSGNRAGQDGLPFIEAGGSAAVDAPPPMLVFKQGEPPPEPRLVAVEIQCTSVLWMDGTISGSIKPAASRYVSDRGNAAQLQFAVDLLRAALAASGTNANAFERLRDGLTALPIDPNPSVVDELMTRPTIKTAGLKRSEVSDGLRSAYAEIKTYILKGLESSIQSGTQAAWLKDAVQRFSAFAERLNDGGR